MWTGFSFYLCWLESSKKQQPFRTSWEKKETTHIGRVCIQTEACVTHVTLKGKGVRGGYGFVCVVFECRCYCYCRRRRQSRSRGNGEGDAHSTGRSIT